MIRNFMFSKTEAQSVSGCASVFAANISSCTVALTEKI